MKFYEFCVEAEKIDQQRVEINNTFVLNFRSSRGNVFKVELEEICEFIKFLHNNFEGCENAIKKDPSFNDSITKYQEKPYRALFEYVGAQNSKLKAISTQGGSQTLQLTQVIDKLICYLAEESYLGVKEKVHFKIDVLEKAIKNIPQQISKIIIDDPNVLKEENIEKFKNWLLLQGLSEGTIEKYAITALKYANERINILNGFTNGKTSVYEIISLKEINSIFNCLNNDQEWNEKNTTGNNMYSAGLNKYKEYIESRIIIPNGIGFKSIISVFIEAIKKANLKFSSVLVSRFISVLLTKPFVIFTGLSGSGKTKLAEAFSKWIAEDQEKQICMVSVGADWTNREPLLGFPNALERGKYVKPDNGVLDLIINASKDPEKPYFLILDEMNMSHVERYFADFLSAMESFDGKISLHSDAEEWNNNEVPSSISLPKNLFIIGTVNVDETTYMFSPKVLDRAQVIEFRVSKEEMDSFLNDPAEIKKECFNGQGASMAVDFVRKAIEKKQPSSEIREPLIKFFGDLQKIGAEFGYRSAVEASRFFSVCEELVKDIKAGTEDKPLMDKDAIIDAVIMQKLLPKVHGSRNKIEKVLKEFGRLCLEDPKEEPFTDNAAGKIKYSLSYEKCRRMHVRVLAEGFTSYTEA